ncbi:MAG: indole-3-glycerol phosphate synthase TrpC [Lentisphaerae bacterium]|nr:indole-3-glycerol phosphate synthase TrpC [Lentisphaerota bacterium]
MKNVLDQIMAERLADVAEASRRVPPDGLRRAANARIHHSLRARLANAGSTTIIAEMKKASPSAGVLRPDYQPVALAREYHDNGAGGLSILTEPRHFLGSDEHLRAVRAAVDLPILRKDFTGDAYQILEAAAWGADVVLLIVAALDGTRLRHLYETAIDLGLDVLVEAHTADEVDRALELDQAIVGVNSRNLKTLKTDLDVARHLAARIPPERLSIAESGISGRAEVVDLAARGYRGFLIGESLLASGSAGAKLRELQGV